MNAFALRLAPGFALLACLITSSRAHAVGVDGPAEATTRVGGGLGAGMDQVDGYGQDAYPYLEAYLHAETLVWRRLFVGGGLSYRQDAENYNYALDRWRGRRAPGLAAQLLVGYDGPSFHVSVGPWLYGSSRDRDGFRAGVMPFGVLRLRFGNLDRWHVKVQLADGAPFTSAGGSLGLRVMVGAPAIGRHRLAAGLYTSVGDKTVGLAFTDEVAGVGPGGTTLRFGALLGTPLDNRGRLELTVFAGLVW